MNLNNTERQIIKEVKARCFCLRNYSNAEDIHETQTHGYAEHSRINKTVNQHSWWTEPNLFGVVWFAGRGFDGSGSGSGGGCKSGSGGGSLVLMCLWYAWSVYGSYIFF